MMELAATVVLIRSPVGYRIWQHKDSEGGSGGVTSLSGAGEEV